MSKLACAGYAPRLELLKVWIICILTVDQEPRVIVNVREFAISAWICKASSDNERLVAALGSNDACRSEDPAGCGTAPAVSGASVRECLLMSTLEATERV